MKREATSYEAALRAFRAVTEAPSDGVGARARVLAGAERRRARGVARRYVALVAGLIVVAGASGAAAWTAVVRWRSEAPLLIEADEGAAPAGVIGRDGARRPALVIPIAGYESRSLAEQQGEGESAVYGRAHRAHFVDDAPARALAAWNTYLAAFPAGAFVIEARYNRALCLARLGKFADASAALDPFARGQFGAYRREEAARLLDWIAARARRGL